VAVAVILSDRMAGIASFLIAGLLFSAFFLCAVPRSAPAGMPERPTTLL